MIIALCGSIGSGKDTVANILIQECGFSRMSFAAPLKRAVAAIFNWEYSLLEGITDESRAWREEVDTWWSKRLDIPNLTPRFALQHIGTDVMRNCFHEDIWAASIEAHLRNVDGNVVLSDCRFPNELQTIRNAGGVVWEVRGKKLPEWYNIAVQANTGDVQAINDLTKFSIHPSETAWIGQPTDAVVNNNSSLASLKDQVMSLYAKM